VLPEKNNFRNQYKDTICRGCNAELETQDHVLNECAIIHIDQETKVQKEDFFSEDINTLKKAAHNIQTILNRIEQSDEPSGLTNHKGRPGIQVYTR
jgi:hypothetical protein